MAGRGLLGPKTQYQRVSPGRYRGPGGQVVNSTVNPGRQVGQGMASAVGRQGNVPQGFGSMGDGAMQLARQGANAAGRMGQQSQALTSPDQSPDLWSAFPGSPASVNAPGGQPQMGQGRFNAWGPTAGMQNTQAPQSRGLGPQMALQGRAMQNQGPQDPKQLFMQGQMSGAGYGGGTNATPVGLQNMSRAGMYGQR